MSFFLTGPIAVSLLVYNERLTVVLGLFTLILALAVFLSCRSGFTSLNKIGLKKPTQSAIKLSSNIIPTTGGFSG
jgi:hypothetical protein